MMKTTKAQQAVAVVAMGLLWASVAAAGIGDFVPNQRYSVPGVVHTTYLATVFQCTSTWPSDWGSNSVTVEVFDHDGLLAGTAQVVLVGGKTAVFTTGNVASLQPDAQMGVTGPLQGSARIMGDKHLICTAWVMSPGSVPGYMHSLPVVKGRRGVVQKGQ
jgi:hypothetical protein